ncbi:MAG TPA: CAP domain-containing protein, partial [Solirubrobacteraceae bacterium]|nr:CAP domain-containing protein [Solirubrobacteraceae bacterium]
MGRSTSSTLLSVAVLALSAAALPGTADAAARSKHKARSSSHRRCTTKHGHRRCTTVHSRARRVTRTGSDGVAATTQMSSGILVLSSNPLPSPAPAVPLNIACAGEDLVPTSADIVAVETATLCLIDQQREQAGLYPLAANLDLEVSSSDYSEQMVSQDFFSHVPPDGETLLSRLTAAGYVSSSADAYVIGENIAWGATSSSTPAETVANWMASSEHRSNILDPTYRDTGIGVDPALPASVAPALAGATYTEDF